MLSQSGRHIVYITPSVLFPLINSFYSDFTDEGGPVYGEVHLVKAEHSRAPTGAQAVRSFKGTKTPRTVIRGLTYAFLAYCGRSCSYKSYVSLAM